MPHKVQIVFQGGGAKFVTLLAAAMAFKEAEALGLIEVGGVSGTSAGSIVAAMYAAGTDLEAVRESTDREDVKALAEYLEVSSISKSNALWRLLRGKPLRDTTTLRNWLTPFFKHCTSQKVGSFKTALTIMTTNLETREEIPARAEDNVVSAIIDSSAIPYFFRVWPRGDAPCIVDGGLCDNLPVRSAQEKQDQLGTVIAVSFKSPIGTRPDNFRSFSAAVLDSILSVGERLSRASLPPSQVIELTTTISTFGFREAFAFTKDIGFARMQQDVLKSIQSFVRVKNREAQVLLIDPWRDSNPTARYLMTQVGKFFDAHQATRSILYSRFRLIVTANSLRVASDPFRELRDEVDFELVISSTDQPISMLSASLTGFDGEGCWLDRDTLTVQVQAPGGMLVQHTLIPMTTASDPKDRDIAICFNPPLPPRTGPYRIDYSVKGRNLMTQLQTLGKDVMMYCPRKAEGDAIQEVELCLYAPANVPVGIKPAGPPATWTHMENELPSKDEFGLCVYAFRTLNMTIGPGNAVPFLALSCAIQAAAPPAP